MMRYRWSVAARVLAAALGGYLLTSALATLLALLLAFERAQAVMAGSDIGVLFYLPALMWAFHARSAARAWAWTASHISGHQVSLGLGNFSTA